jgi:hypothetical protein
MEVPIGDAIAGGDDASRRPEQRQHGIDRLIDRVRLEPDNDVILLTELGRIIGAAKVRDMLSPVVLQTQASGAYGLEMSASGDQADVSPGAGKAYAEKTPDRAGTEDANLHFLS